MSEKKQFFARYGKVEKGDEIAVTQVVYPAEFTNGEEVLESGPGDRGTVEGIEEGFLYIRRSDGTLRHYHLDNIRGVEHLSDPS